MKCHPCHVCTQIIFNNSTNLCTGCTIMQSTDLSIFEQICAICQYDVKQFGKITKCCEKLLHITCYKIYKHKQLISFKYTDDDDDDISVKCPYCRGHLH